ncbi:MAG: class I SAM-dependent methyltransferase [Actinobacteria bacterium]|nr:class I SAM-dependent methyltransferase [Actinomycetota bacterium]
MVKGQKSFDHFKSTERSDPYSSLDIAEQNANIGSTVPPFNKSFFFKRKIYKSVTKLLFKVLKVITVNQRNFNLSVLDAFRNIIDDNYHLKLRFAETKIQFDTRITEFMIKIDQQNIEIDGLKSTVDYLKNSLFQLEQRINNISGGAGKSAEKDGKNKVQNLTNELSHDLDSFYVFLEDNLRGSHKEIKRRLQVYIPFIKEADAGSKNSPILDIGCGRGEWLELLKEAGLHAKGLDFNGIMIKTCKDRGLDVVQDEALSFLKNLPDHNLGAVTGFHLIEHCRFEFLIKLLDEILRVLKPGGLVILETPNPGNVIVGSCSFYLDPSHIKPLPGALIKLVLESLGFNKVNVMYLNPYGNDYAIKDNGFETSKRFNDYFYGPQDYAVVGYKL